MKRSRRKSPLRFILLAVTLVAASAVVAVVSFLSYVRTPFAIEKDMLVEVMRGDSASKILSRLAAKGVAEKSVFFLAMIKLKGGERNILPGYYAVRKGDTPEGFWSRVMRGELEKNRLTIPEGYNIYQIAQVLEEQRMGAAKRFLSLVRDRKFIEQLGLKLPVLEGYLFPATYYFDPGYTEEEMVKAMVKKTFSVLRDELGIADDPQRTVDIHRILTLASMIEREAKVKAEMPLIAAVFANRLKKGMKLQCDPTVIYGIKGFDGRLTREQLHTKTAYNTYTNYGLPPTPIANPSKEAIMSALKPAEDDYLYFVSKNDGTHYFSNTLEKHNKAVYIHQKRKVRGSS